MIPVDTYTLLTFAVSRAPASSCQEAAKKMLNDESLKWKFSEMELDLDRIYTDMPPYGGAHLPKFVIWKPAATEGSVFLCNLQDGWPMFVRGLSRQLPEPFIHVRMSNNYDLQPVCSIGYWVGGVNERCVQVLKDAKWDFSQRGPVLPFESQENYLQRRVRDRFTKQILIEYLKRLDWDIEKSGFWQTEASAFYGQKLRHR